MQILIDCAKIMKVHNMKFQEQIYSKFESMDCVSQSMKKSAGYQEKMMFGSGDVNCPQIRVILAPKTWNLVQKRPAKMQERENGERRIFRKLARQNGSHQGEQERTMRMPFCSKKDISSGEALYLKAKINGEPNILVPELTCTLNLVDFEIWNRRCESRISKPQDFTERMKASHKVA